MTPWRWFLTGVVLALALAAGPIVREYLTPVASLLAP